MTTAAQPSNDPALMLIRDRAQAVDEFKVKISRRRAGAFQGPQMIAGFDKVTYHHFEEINEWLPALVGGGIFVVEIYQSGNAVSFPEKLTFDFGGQEREITYELAYAVISSPDWQGPKKLTHPRADVFFDRGAGSVIGDPGSPRKAPDRSPIEHSFQNSRVDQLAAQLQAMEQRDREREHRRDLEERDRRHAEELRALREEFRGRAPEPKRSEGLADVVGQVVPLLVKMIDGQQSMRLEMMKQESEGRRAAADAARGNTEMLIKVMESAKPRERDIGAEASAMAKMTAVAMSSVRVVADMVADKAPGHPAMEILEGVRDAAVAFGEGLAKTQRAGMHGYVQQTQPTQQQVTAGAEKKKPAPEPEAEGQTVLEKIKQDILQHIQPSSVAVLVLDAVQQREPSVDAAMRAVGGDPEKFARKLLGTAWLIDKRNLAYRNELLDEIDKLATARGLQGPKAPAATPEPEQEAEVSSAEEQQ